MDFEDVNPCVTPRDDHTEMCFPFRFGFLQQSLSRAGQQYTFQYVYVVPVRLSHANVAKLHKIHLGETIHLVKKVQISENSSAIFLQYLKSPVLKPIAIIETYTLQIFIVILLCKSIKVMGKMYKLMKGKILCKNYP